MNPQWRYREDVGAYRIMGLIMEISLLELESLTHTKKTIVLQVVSSLDGESLMSAARVAE